MNFSFRTREQNIEILRRHSGDDATADQLDLLVIGGGITGAGVARDAASRGMKVALVEAQDFAVGTSSRSSKLIHGGIRYLENFEFSLVFEALTERRNLFEIAPHLVHPLRFILPIYKDSRVGMFKMGLGMWLYDALSSFEAPEMHERLNSQSTIERAPMLNTKNLVGSYVYSDAYMDDDRLVIETLRSAANFGATAANYVRATGAEQVDGKVRKVNCRDELTGKEFTIQARHIISTVGPWTDIVGSSFFPKWKRRLRPSKGVHLTLRRDRLKLNDAIVMVSDDQKRIVFAIPRNEMIILGTTDTDFPKDPGLVKTERQDVDYLLHVAENYFPGAKIAEGDILSSYSGVRPLVDDGSATESKTSREHLIFTEPHGVTFVTGGKYTTYRKIAEDAMEEVLGHFCLEDRLRYSRSQTLKPLNPLATQEYLLRTRSQAERISREFGLNVGIVNMLVERHAGEAVEILHNFAHKAHGRAHAVWSIEALHAIHQTMCINLIDYYLRRSPLFLSRQDHGFLYLNEIAEIFRNELGWSESEFERQKNSLRQHLDYEMSWRGTSATSASNISFFSSNP